MIAIVTVLFAFPLGFFLRNRNSAFIAYVAIFGYSFTFQTLYLLRSWIGDRALAFPKDPNALPFSYLGITGAIYLIGFGLIVFGHYLGAKRRARTTAAVDLDSTHL
jgi:hypothetical protein